MSCPEDAGRGASASPSDAARQRADLPRSAKVTARRDFQRVYAEGYRAMGAHFVLFGRLNDRDNSRLGLTVSRKCGGAVTRNRIKRLFREVFRRCRRSLGPPLDLVVNARPGADSATLVELEREFLSQHAAVVRRLGR